MDSINSEVPAAPAPVIRTEPSPRVWKFWGTALWGLFIFAAMFVGQIGWCLVRIAAGKDRSIWPPRSTSSAAGLTISLSVIMGLPAFSRAVDRHPHLAHAVCRISRAAPAVMDRPSDRYCRPVCSGHGWDLLSRATGREVAPGFMR